METLVDSPVPRKNEDRKKETYSVYRKTADLVRAYSERTGVPMGRVIDKAVAEYLKEDPAPARQQEGGE